MIIAFENEPLPVSPDGKSMALKLGDWLDLADLVPAIELDVRPIGELGADKPVLIEAFASHAGLLGAETMPSAAEHQLALDLRAYWPAVIKSGVPAIPVYPVGYVPTEYPVYVRGRTGSLSQSKVNSVEEFKAVANVDGMVARPWVRIQPCGDRDSVTKELRVHVVCGTVACVEFLFPQWAAQKPTDAELAAGRAWTRTASAEVVAWSETLAKHLNVRWFAADFAQTDAGVKLVEVIPGWCSGITDPCSARAVHAAILESMWEMDTQPLWLKPTAQVPWVRMAAGK